MRGARIELTTLGLWDLRAPDCANLALTYLCTYNI